MGKDNNIATNLLAIVGFPVTLAVVVGVIGFYHAWVVSLLWAWFIPVTFPNLPIVSIWQAWGIIMIVGSLRYVIPSDKKTSVAGWVTYLIAPLLTLLVGLLVRTQI